MPSEINRYKIVTDENGYITCFYKVTGNNYDFEGQMAEHSFVCEGWTKFESGEFVEDLEKKEEIQTLISNRNEIEMLKQNLVDTDYIFSKELEEITALSNPLTFIADVIKILVSYASTYKDVITQRKAWRSRIEELEESSE